MTWLLASRALWRLFCACNMRLRRVGICAGPASPSYFAFFSTQKDAALAAQTRIHPEDSHSFRVMEAPGPEEVHLPLMRTE